MFSKGAKARQNATPSAAPPVPSLIGPGLLFEGAITGEGELHVEGAAKGRIEAVRVVVGEGGEVEGVVRAGAVEIRGRFRGEIEAQSVKLYATARVEGDIVHEQLQVEAGAVFEGRSHQAKRLAAPIEAPPQLAAPHVNGSAHAEQPLAN